MTNIVDFTGVTKGKIPPDTILKSQIGKLESLVYCGRDKDGNFIAGASIGDVGETLLLIELLKQQLMEGVE